MMRSLVVATAVLALAAAGCSSDSDEATQPAAADSSAATGTESEPEAEVAGVTESLEAEEAVVDDPDDVLLGDPDRSAALGRACGNNELPIPDQFTVTAQSGLRARQLPGNGDIITVLPNGTIVDTFPEQDTCGVLDDGSIWFNIGTPLLATGGWVHSGFLEPAS